MFESTLSYYNTSAHYLSSYTNVILHAVNAKFQHSCLVLPVHSQGKGGGTAAAGTCLRFRRAALVPIRRRQHRLHSQKRGGVDPAGVEGDTGYNCSA